jgi:3-phosphoshikimate 1-carboxyvinyltransferase
VRHASPERLTARPGDGLRGDVRAPGDKSISHRALILGVLAAGESRVEGLLESDDVLRTSEACRAFGATVERSGEGAWRVESAGRWRSPEGTVDCGNSGTGVRLLMGAAAGYDLAARFDGDGSLRKRPMARVIEPLTRMGARFETADGRLPLTLRGGGLRGIVHRSQVASAQVKSAILLAGLNADGETVVVEPEPTRDHTERMLAACGAEVSVTETADGRRVSIRPGALSPAHFRVPGDPSSAAFPLVAALIVPGSAVTVRGVLLNPSRTGLFDTLREMGADLEIAETGTEGGEPVGDVTARSSALRGVEVPAGRAPSMIDEYPILAVAAAFAEGGTVMRGVGELRVKESDRAALTVEMLRACGAQAEARDDVLEVSGTGRALRGGALVRTCGDHRIAMAGLVAGLAAAEPVSADEPAMIATSFPTFVDLMRVLGARID